MGEFFLIFVSILFLYLKKKIRKKIGLYILRFVSILFLVFEKGDKRENWAKFFEGL